MAMGAKFYITTTAPYVNSSPHLGFALEIVQADAIARLKRLLGEEVLFGFGTDEHGLKIYRKALEDKLDPQKYCDSSVVTWNKLKTSLNLSYTNFIRTTDPKHIEAAQQLWERCNKAGDIYKKIYKSKYCVGCELEKTDSELVEGKCPLHPNLELEIIDEENYFFRFSKYQKPLLDFYTSHPDFVKPESKFKEITTFVKNGLNDFSISRLKSKMPWGVPVPDDPDQVMYVWFDALTFYISNLGWPENEENFKAFWPGIQVAGKDNLRQQTAIWQAMLLSAGLPNSKQVFIHGFLTLNGAKISKSAGNSIDPIELVEKYGTDALRYYLLAKIHPFEDSDFTYAKFEENYNADLANGLGNLVARVAKLAELNNFNFKDSANGEIYKEVQDYLNIYRFDLALEFVWEKIRQLDKFINDNKPWEKKGEELGKILQNILPQVQQIAYNLQPFLPDTAEKILEQFKGPKIISGEPLFPRLK